MLASDSRSTPAYVWLVRGGEGGGRGVGGDHYYSSKTVVTAN